MNRLKINQNELREICVISGTDYNSNHLNKCDLFNTLKYFKKYKKCINTEETTTIKGSFYNWLIENTNYVEINENESINKFNEDLISNIYINTISNFSKSNIKIYLK